MPQTEAGWQKHFVWWFTKTADGAVRIFCTLERRWLPAHDYVFNEDAGQWVYRDIPSYDE